jgi:hypothetical protein
MAHAAPLPQQAPRIAPTSGDVAAGGPIAELQRSIEHRLRADVATPLDEAKDDVAHRLSRLVGPMLLVGAYSAVAAWWF